MKYILSSNIALRSWERVPYAYYVHSKRDAMPLTKEQFSILRACDGEHELSEDGDGVVKALCMLGMISPAVNGERLTKWQQYRHCDNRYFPAVSWMITGKCNLNCLHCFNAADNAPLMSEFTWDEAQKLICEAEACGINAFTLTGGEPMLHPHFFEIVSSIYSHGMYVRDLNTNGCFLTEQALSKLKAFDSAIRIKISFDGIGHHDWLRNRKGAEEEALRAIRACIRAGFFVQVQMNVHRNNLDSLLKTAEMMDELGVEHLRVIRTTEAPRWLQNARDATLGIGEYYDCMTDFLREYAKKRHKMSIDVWQFAMAFPASRSFRARPVECSCGEYRDSLPVCRGNRGMISIDADGGLVPCHQLSGFYHSRSWTLGNVKKDGLKPHLQEGQYLDEVTTTLKTLAEHNRQCAECKYFRYCVGGCRAIAVAFTGDKLGIDPTKCKFFKEGYYQKLKAALCDWRDLAPVAVE